MTITAPPYCFESTESPLRLRAPARRVTSYDVALAAGVSQSAVSRCFKPGASVSKDTFARVMQAARQLDYTPNAAARSLITRRSNLVALIISSQFTLHYPEVLSELSREFALRGMRIVLFSMANESQVDRTLAEVWQHTVDGAVVVANLSTEQMAEFERRQIPFVMFNRSDDDHLAPAVLCDQQAAARLITTRLAAAGHKTFALIDSPATSLVATRRKQGVIERLAELGLAAPLVVPGGYDYASGARGLRDIVERLGRAPDAVICGTDIGAIGCLDAARHDLKLDVPNRMSVAGLDGIAASDWLSYNLTTLRQPVHSMTAAASDMLTTLIRHGTLVAEQRHFSATVVEGSTARLGPEF